jgi:hypothetical protein
VSLVGEEKPELDGWMSQDSRLPSGSITDLSTEDQRIASEDGSTRIVVSRECNGSQNGVLTMSGEL